MNSLVIKCSPGSFYTAALFEDDKCLKNFVIKGIDSWMIEGEEIPQVEEITLIGNQEYCGGIKKILQSYDVYKNVLIKIVTL